MRGTPPTKGDSKLVCTINHGLASTTPVLSQAKVECSCELCPGALNHSTLGNMQSWRAQPSPIFIGTAFG